MPLTPDRSLIAKIDLFSGLDADALDDVVRRGHTRRLPKDMQVLVQGDPATTCHAVIDGRIKISQTTPDGGQVVLRYLGPGEMYGTLAVLMGIPLPADAIAVVDSVEIYWPAAAMADLIERHPKIALASSRLAGGRLVDLQTRLREVTTERVEQRLARTLLRMLGQAGRRTAEGVEIDFPITRQELGEMIGATLHTVSRTLSAWEEHGIVESSRRRIVVRDPDALAAIAEEPRPPAAAAP
ncbi:Crp/Fnr family transcriptional regulator [Arenibaculum sp.]|jgi:CRP-like cAMP-binding protein|uniref:Crp/Fnr family transcriptional regulator n=1 Tax=Arenibaculum sp. TaxID=2865862 RepID=UPI002E0FB55C|nr:Crp/Fnr family transcriptional regulator [Arenibaculum sp.]